MYKTLNQFRDLTKGEGQYRSNEAENAMFLASVVGAFHPAEPLFDVEEGGELHHAIVVLQHPELQIRIEHYSHTNRYEFYLLNESEFRHIDNGDRRQIREQLTEPKGVGVLTTKKIEAWVKYYEEYYKLLKEKDEKIKAKVAAFIASLEGLPVEWSKDKQWGWIKKDNLEFNFEIYKNGYIKQEIRVRSHSLESFRKITGL